MALLFSIFSWIRFFVEIHFTSLSLHPSSLYAPTSKKFLDFDSLSKFSFYLVFAPCHYFPLAPYPTIPSPLPATHFNLHLGSLSNSFACLLLSPPHPLLSPVPPPPPLPLNKTVILCYALQHPSVHPTVYPPVCLPKLFLFFPSYSFHPVMLKLLSCNTHLP